MQSKCGKCPSATGTNSSTELPSALAAYEMDFFHVSEGLINSACLHIPARTSNSVLQVDLFAGKPGQEVLQTRSMWASEYAVPNAPFHLPFQFLLNANFP